MSVDPVHARHRRTLDANDFELAAKYARRLQQELSKRGSIAVDLEAIEALWAAVVMSYGRPFTFSYTEDREARMPCYRRELKRVLPSQLLPLHDELIEARHQKIAHSDPLARRPREKDLGRPFGMAMTVKVQELPSVAAQDQIIDGQLLDLIEVLSKHTRRARESAEADENGAGG